MPVKLASAEARAAARVNSDRIAAECFSCLEPA